MNHSGPAVIQTSSSRRLALGLADTALLIMGLVAVAIWLTVSLAHLHDRSALNHVSGEWIGLAYYAKAGTLYPKLFDDGFYGGTRYGAVPILLHAAGYSLTGDPIASGKLLSLAGMALLLVAMSTLLIRAGATAGLAAIACALLLVTPMGWANGTTINCDALALGLQLVAMTVAYRRDPAIRARLGPALAGGLCAVAFFVKPSAVFATLAIPAFYLLNDRRALVPFFVSAAFVGSGLAGLVYWLSEGRIAENYANLLLAGESASSFGNLGNLVRSFVRVIYAMQHQAKEAWAIVPVCIVVFAAACVRRRWSLIQVAMPASFLVTLALFTNPGIAANHLMDLVCVLILVAVEAAAAARNAVWARDPSESREGERARGNRVVFVYLAVLFLWVSASALQISGHFADARQSVRILRGDKTAIDPNLAPSSWRERFGPNDRLLSCDASIPVLMGRRPVILNSFMLKVVADRNPIARDALIRRIDAKEFDWVVSVAALRGPWADARLEDAHWGHAIVDAIDRNYEPRGRFWDYELYAPKGQ